MPPAWRSARRLRNKRQIILIYSVALEFFPLKLHSKPSSPLISYITARTLPLVPLAITGGSTKMAPLVFPRDWRVCPAGTMTSTARRQSVHLAMSICFYVLSRFPAFLQLAAQRPLSRRSLSREVIRDYFPQKGERVWPSFRPLPKSNAISGHFTASLPDVGAPQAGVSSNPFVALTVQGSAANEKNSCMVLQLFQWAVARGHCAVGLASY